MGTIFFISFMVGFAIVRYERWYYWEWWREKFRSHNSKTK